MTKQKARPAREAAMQSVYAYELSGEIPSLEDSCEADVEDGVQSRDSVFVERILKLIPEKLPEVDAHIEDNLEKWTLQRISKVDLAILRVAILEMEYLSTAPKLAINEAVEMAKKYSGDKAYQFVNGVLAGYYRKRQETKNRPPGQTDEMDATSTHEVSDAVSEKVLVSDKPGN